MINLIPNEEKKKTANDLYFRLITVFFTMLGLFLFVGSVSLLPSYILSSTEKSYIDSKLEIQKNEPPSESDRSMVLVVKDLNSKLNLIEKSQKNEDVFSEKVINGIVLKKLSDIKITEIYYERDISGGEKINVIGKASSREKLLLFRKMFEDDTAFSEVDLPISNFVKGSNIGFNLTLIPS